MKDSNNLTKVSRRHAMRLAGMTAISLLANTHANGSTQSVKQPKENQPATLPKDPSVFQNDKCRAGNSAKYANYDKDIVYPLLAFWLMLTTDEWDECLKDSSWRAQLASELKLKPEHLEQLYKDSHNTKTQRNSFSNSEAFNRVKKLWYDFIDANSFYGGRPCPGGKTLLQISRGFEK
jgi:hypothetical protein